MDTKEDHKMSKEEKEELNLKEKFLVRICIIFYLFRTSLDHLI